MYKKILVPLDGSELAEGVLVQVGALAKCTGAELVLLRVVPAPVDEPVYVELPLLPASPARSGPQPDLWAQAEGYLQRVAFEYFPAANVSVEVCGGPTVDTILDYAADDEVALIAMSTHGRGGLSRMMLGSIADEIVRRSHLPVLLVRPQ